MNVRLTRSGMRLCLSLNVIGGFWTGHKYPGRTCFQRQFSWSTVHIAGSTWNARWSSSLFAEGYPRDEHGWVLFPVDTALRRRLFVPDVMTHPARANLHLVRAIVEHLTKPGQTVMDITAGTGSILVAAEMGRRVICVELNPVFAGWIEASKKQSGLDALVLVGDCRAYLPLAADLICFSPPYAKVLHKGSGSGLEAGYKMSKRGRTDLGSVDDTGYIDDLPGNLGNLPDFMFNQEMEGIYRLCLQSLSPGGKIAVIIKDRIQAGQRIELSLHAVRTMSRVGFRFFEWHRWKAPGMFADLNLSRGIRAVEDECIVICEKP